MRIYLLMQMNFCANRCQCQKGDANPDLFPSKQIALDEEDNDTNNFMPFKASRLDA